MEHEDDSDTKCNWWAWNNPQRLGTIPKGLEKGLEELKIGERVHTIQTRALLRLARIARKVRDLRELAVTQTPMKNHQLILV